jgi:hypothetical protein
MWPRSPTWALWVLVLCAGCFDPISPVQHSIRQASDKREAGARWAGEYRFRECAQNACWDYVLVVQRDGEVKITASGPDLDLRCIARPRPKNDELHLTFESYADGKTHLDVMGLTSELHSGSRVATLTRRGACLRFEDLESKIGTKVLCR